MKNIIFLFLAIFALSVDPAQAEDSALPPNFLFDDSDIIVSAPTDNVSDKEDLNTEENISDAVNSAKALLGKRPIKLRSNDFKIIKTRNSSGSLANSSLNFQDAPFGLRWGVGISDTRNQGVTLTVAEMEDYVNCFLADKLPKPINLFNRVYVCYGEDDKLYRILAYSRLIDDDSSASKILHEYDTYSALLEQKYGNKEQDFTPATITKTVKNSQGKDETISEEAPIGNPNFLAQLESGNAVLFSTYYNDDVAAALSIGVDGDKKSYIVIDYKNLQILKKQEAETLDAL